jgi:hypothetical protein
MSSLDRNVPAWDEKHFEATGRVYKNPAALTDDNLEWLGQKFGEHVFKSAFTARRTGLPPPEDDKAWVTARKHRPVTIGLLWATLNPALDPLKALGIRKRFK